MPALISHQLSFQLSTGEWLFKDLNFNLEPGLTGLVGRNGSGKSVLVSLLNGSQAATKGYVQRQGKIGFYSQLPSELLSSDITISDYLGLTEIRLALRAIEAGHCDDQYFDLIGEDWDIESRTQSILADLRVPCDLDTQCSTLSGGQLALLQLYKLFESDTDILLLDEPSNHLDSVGKAWLVQRLKTFSQESSNSGSHRSVLLVSHDRSLLRRVGGIYQLTKLGLRYFKGNYDHFLEQTTQQSTALNRQIDHLKTEKKKIERQAQVNREKAQQREAQGNRIRKSGSQPKILMDAMKGKAEKTRSALLTNQHNQMGRNQEKLQSLMKQKEILKPQAMYLQSSSEVKKRTLVNLEECRLDFGSGNRISMVISQSDRCYLQGNNGCGKSTLLKAIQGLHNQYRGELKVMTKTMYLDQHFGLFENEDSMLDSLMHTCRGLIESEARTLLAGIGFRRDSVHREVKHLSGGEKMKLSMLMVSHIEDAPLLLLDEPDNHLDIESKRILAEALNQYKGSFILVSHDEGFVEDVGVNKRISLS